MQSSSRAGDSAGIEPSPVQTQEDPLFKDARIILPLERRRTVWTDGKANVGDGKKEKNWKIIETCRRIIGANIASICNRFTWKQAKGKRRNSKDKEMMKPTTVVSVVSVEREDSVSSAISFCKRSFMG